MVGEAQIGHVEGTDVEPAGLAKAVTLRVRGAAIGIETARGRCRKRPCRRRPGRR